MALEAEAPVALTAAEIAAALARDMPASRIHTGGLGGLAVDGVEPSVVVRPTHPDEAAAVVARCDELGAAVVPRGGGSQMALGNIPERVDVVLDTTALDEIVTYTPADLTLGVQAGITLAALQARLGEEGQHLPLDPPFAASATLGGLMATNTSGPRRVASGSFRDLVIGAEAAGPDGTITKSGGMVVKNVTGYDLHKGHIGALGTLGLITRVNLKVAPLPTKERTAVHGYASALDAGGAVGAIVSLPVAPTAVDLVDRRLVVTADVPDRPWLLAVRFAGTEAGVARATGHGPRGARLEWRRPQHPGGPGSARLLARCGERGGTAPRRLAVYRVPHERPLIAASVAARVGGRNRRGARSGVACGGARRERRRSGALDGRRRRRGPPRGERPARRRRDVFRACRRRGSSPRRQALP